MTKKIYLIFTILLISYSYTWAQETKGYEAYIKDALDYTDKKDYAAAEQSYKAAMRLEPANAANKLLMFNLGTIQRYLGKYEEALISYNIVVQHYPTRTYVLENRARLYCEMNRYEDALKDYSAIILHEPENLDALYNRGLIMLSLRRLNEAEADFKTILVKAEGNTLAQEGLAMILKRKEMWKEAEEAYSNLIAEDKKNGKLYANRAECYLNLKKLRSMGDDLDKALEYGYNDYSVYILKGQLRLAQYDKLTAKMDFEKAIEMGADKELVQEFLEMCK